MDFLSNLSKNDDHKSTNSDDPNHSDAHHKPTKSDLIHSAKVVADAARAHVNSEPEKYDKAELAGATADLLDAAAEYGKLDDKAGIGKYVDKAEDYLRKYQTSHHTPDGAGKTDHHKPEKSAEQHKSEKSDEHHKPAKGEEHHKPEKGEEHGGGAGDFLKMAGDFLYMSERFAFIDGGL